MAMALRSAARASLLAHASVTVSYSVMPPRASSLAIGAFSSYGMAAWHSGAWRCRSLARCRHVARRRLMARSRGTEPKEPRAP